MAEPTREQRAARMVEIAHQNADSDSFIDWTDVDVELARRLGDAHE